MNLNIEHSLGVTVVTVQAARIDAAVALQFKDMMRKAVADAGPRVVLDLAQVTFLDSSGLGAIVAAMKHLDGDRKLELAGLTPAVAKVFRLTRLDSVFTIHDDVAAATMPERRVG